MEQFGTVILEYSSPQGPGGVGYWTGTVEGREMKLCRVIAGLAIPQLTGQLAALIILGELHLSSQPMDLHGLGAAVGSWSEVKNALIQTVHDQKPDRIIVENEQNRKLVWKVTDPMVGIKPLPLCYAAPPEALTEVGHANVDALIEENRLHIDHLLGILDREKDQSDKALRLAVNWCCDTDAFYPRKKKVGQPTYKKIWGTEGL
jgi:hypothetical protein